MKKIKLAIDAKELAKEHIGSLGFVLLELFKYLDKYDLVLLSDINLPEKYIPNNAVVVARNQAYLHGKDLVKYGSWIRKKCIEQRVDCYFQINHFSLFKMKDIKQIVVIHDLYPLEGIEKYRLSKKVFYAVALAITLVNADSIFTVSNFTKRRLEHFFWRSQKVKVDYNGVTFPHTESDFKIIDGKFLLLLGRVSYWKGTISTAKFFDRYFKNSKYKLVIAGQAENKCVATDMRKLTENKNIVWLDYVDNNTKAWLLRNATLFLYPSRYDGFGLPPLEAAIVKTPVLMNDIAVLREVTQNAGNYIDFYGDENNLYKKMMDLLLQNDTSKTDQLYEIASSYTWEKYAMKIVNEIEKLCE